MNLVIDQGNSFAKVYLFHNDKPFVSACFQPPIHQKLNQFYAENGFPKNAIYSSVGAKENAVEYFLAANCQNYFYFSPQLPVPLKIDYATPETLGSDRIAASVGATSLYNGHNLLIIDAGTAITFDFVDKDGVFKGGNIAPGVNLRFKALHQYTHKLPLVAPDEEFHLTGNSTYQAVLFGVMNSVLFEIEQYIHCYRQQYPDIKCVLTGGDASYFVKKIKNDIFAVPDLVAIGLNRILNYNVL